MEEMLAYFAGFFDGEGCVVICKSKGNKGTPWYKLQVSTYQKSPEVLYDMKDAFGGSVCRISNRGFIGYQWAASSKQAANFLRRVYPYLRVKKEQVKVALEFADFVAEKPIPSGRGCDKMMLPETRLQILERREVYFQELLRVRRSA